MRLLHTTRIEVVEFVGPCPSYAILSHRWEEEEVTLRDLQPDGRAKQMKGYAKIQNSCGLAARKGFQYIWIDTCCIDKTSSAELSEAINSMFRWYQEAKICYAFLSDVLTDVPANTPIDPSTITTTTRAAAMRKMTASRWFTRGWTLQELVVPRALDFYSQEWIYLGSRDAAAKTIELATGIPARVLFRQGLSGLSVHQRMRWAATRTTTRPEDIAYCLLGIFDVNMPLLYGEGKKKAFQRLQEEIVKISTDLSLFLWTVSRNEQEGPDLDFRGPLAEDPSWFTASGFRPKNDSRIVSLQDTAMGITNKGISVQWTIFSVRGDPAKTLYVAMLAGAGEIKGGIVIQQLDEEATQFCRVLSDKVIWLDRQGVVTEVLNHDLLRHPKDLLVTSSPAEAKSFYMHRNFDPSNIPSLPGVGFSFTQRIISNPKNASTRTWLHAPLCASVKAASPEFYLDSDFPERTWCAQERSNQTGLNGVLCAMQWTLANCSPFHGGPKALHRADQLVVHSLLRGHARDVTDLTGLENEHPNH